MGADPVEGFKGERGNHPVGPCLFWQPAGTSREGPLSADAGGMVLGATFVGHAGVGW